MGAEPQTLRLDRLPLGGGESKFLGLAKPSPWNLQERGFCALPNRHVFIFATPSAAAPLRPISKNLCPVIPAGA